MAYDTALPTAAPLPPLRGVRGVVGDRARWPIRPRARVLVGVPTYDETGLCTARAWRRRRTRSLGVVAGLRGMGGGGTFEGVALYAEWTTDERSGRSTSASGAGGATARIASSARGTARPPP